MKRIFILMILCFSMSAGADTAEKLLETQRDIHNKKIEYYSEKEKFEENRNSLEDKYLSLKKAIAENQAYVETLRKVNKDLKERVDIQKRKVKLSRTIGSKIDNLLHTLLLDIENHINNSPGYSLTGRLTVVTNLRESIFSGGLSTQEKIRRVMELYMVEADLARFAEVYEEQIEFEGRKISGYFLRFGGVAQFFASPDGKFAASYNPSIQGFEEIPFKYAERIITAAKIIDKRAMPELVNLPLGRLAE